MADTVIVSTSNADMVDYPLAIQATGSDPEIEYGAQEHFRQFLDAMCITGGGRLKFGEFKLSQRAAGANFSVDLSAGYYVISGTTSPTTVQGKYLVHTTAVINIVTPSAPASGTRVHRIVAQVNDKAVDGGSSYGWRIWLLEDTGSGTPAVPANARNVGTVSISSGQANVLNSHITDGQEYAIVAHGGLGVIQTKEFATTGTALYTGTPGETVTFAGMTDAAYLVAGRRYTIRWKVKHTNTSAGVVHTLYGHAGATGTDVSIGVRLGRLEVYYPVAGRAPSDLLELDFEPAVSGTYHLNLGIGVSGGTVSVFRGTPDDINWITVEDKGSNTDDRIVRATGA